MVRDKIDNANCQAPCWKHCEAGVIKSGRVEAAWEALKWINGMREIRKNYMG